MKFLLSIILIFVLISSPLLTFFIFSKNVYADGLFMEELTASFGDRTADLLIKMDPPVVTTETIQDQAQKPAVQFKLFDSTTNQTFKEVTYFITIEKNGKTLLSDWFFSSDGDLLIQMQPRNQSQISVYGELDPILEAYASREGSPVVAAGPIFLEGGLYHFIVRIVTVDFSRTILPDDQQPVFDGWLSIGAAKNANLTVDGKTIPIKVLSYYDEIGNITNDQSSNSINFTMPFSYDPKRLNDPKNSLFIHQEVEVPKPSVLSADGAYKGYTNGKDVTNVLMVDGNNQTKDVIHFMLAKPIVQQISDEYLKKINKTSADGLMTFSLGPSKNGSMAMGGGVMNHTMMAMQQQ
ncbi:MAG: hypothetical protein M3Q77_10250 [Thermoproteota archaeon]|nr:hypothetical protein [Nitrosopumilus sp.]MDQ3085170.1 hypothetical protein [Thermoproteota archaeon]